jgi:hypothetical protein
MDHHMYGNDDIPSTRDCCLLRTLEMYSRLTLESDCLYDMDCTCLNKNRWKPETEQVPSGEAC